MSDLDITREAVIQLCDIVKQLTCCVGRESNAPDYDFVAQRLGYLFNEAEQIQEELKRP
jgi:hypothetical protein